MTILRTIFLLCLLALGTFGVAVQPVSAQSVSAQSVFAQSGPAPQAEAGGPAYDEWDRIASRAEDAVETGRASATALEELRATIVGWRSRFVTAQDVNSARIRTVESQIAALGALPEGGVEAVEIAARRENLIGQLAELRAPVQRAEVAFERADGIVREIDLVLRQRESVELLRLSPTPLNPALWGDGAQALGQIWRGVSHELTAAWNNDAEYYAFRQNLPTTLIYLAIGLLLLLRGRRWIERLARRVRGDGLTSLQWIKAFFLSFGQVILPYVGVLALVQAALSTQLTGAQTNTMLNALGDLVFTVLVARWLALLTFPRNPDLQPLLDFREKHRLEGRWTATMLGLLLGLFDFLRKMVQFENFSESAKGVLLFPVVLLAGYLLVRLGLLLGRHVREQSRTTEAATYRNRVILILGRATMVAGAFAPIVAAIGYSALAIRLSFPMIETLGLLAFLAALHRLVRETYGVVAKDENPASEALWPVLITIVLTLFSTPFFLVIWGVPRTRLLEFWDSFKVGFSLGDGVRISPTDFLIFALVFAAGYAVTRFVQGTMRTSILPRTKIDPGGQTAIVSGMGYVGIFLAALLAISTTGINLTSFAVVAGALSVGIGFGLQTIVSNFVSGIILLVERPISEGDWIEVGGQMGYVRDISVRATRIETFDRTDVIIPNGDLVSGVVTNWTRGNLTGRLILPVGVAYGSDTRKVESILLEIAKAQPLVVAKPPPAVLFRNFGADSLDFEIRAILRDINFKLSVQSDMNHEIARRFAEEGIEIPFAQRDIWLRNPEVLNANKGDT